MATTLSIADLADVLAALTAVTKPYQLGIQLKIDSSDLKAVENDHPKDTDRQKAEVIEYWLRNSPDASWTTLANAVERMGGYARLAETLREKEQRDEKSPSTQVLSHEPTTHELLHVASVCVPESEIPSRSTSLNKAAPRKILLLGKMGHGKSTLGNRILNSDGCFKISDQMCLQTLKGEAILDSKSQLKSYKIKVYDHNGLFEGVSSINTISSKVGDSLHLVVFVLKRGCSFDESEVEILSLVTCQWRINRISALVLTHCERLSEEQREEMIEQFKKDHLSVAELMGKGILAVGFPDSSRVKDETELSERVEGDKAKLRQLIYSCDKPVHIRRPPRPSRTESGPCSRCSPCSHCSIL